MTPDPQHPLDERRVEAACAAVLDEKIPAWKDYLPPMTSHRDHIYEASCAVCRPDADDAMRMVLAVAITAYLAAAPSSQDAAPAADLLTRLRTLFHEGTPQAFLLDRREDVTGVSGTGPVAEGVRFSDGTVALRWTSDWPTSVVFHDRGVESVEAVHGHDGRTQIVWLGKTTDELLDAITALHPAPPADAAPGLRAAAENLAMRIGGIYRCPICDKNGYAHKEWCPVLAVWHALNPAAALAPPSSPEDAT